MTIARTRWIVLCAVWAVAIALGTWVYDDPYGPGRAVVGVIAPHVKLPEPPVRDTPVELRGPDGRVTLIALEPQAKGFSMPTDLQFVPGSSTTAIVLEKAGRAHGLALPSGEHALLFSIDVLTESEEGLLGLAFHPQFADNGRFFVNYVARGTPPDKRHFTRIAEWRADTPKDVLHCTKTCMHAVRVLLEVEQPFSNHNAGQLAFGPDGFLYVGFGDGGARDDPYGHAQKLETLLGSMLRIDVDHDEGGRGYGIPKDNPFLGREGVPPETYAYGLRNPWRYSFDPKGRLIVADVGQDHWEEVSIVRAGDNLGWDLVEGFECSSKAAACNDGSLVAPVVVYGRELGVSITGGFVYTGSEVPVLRGKYVFGDFGSGRLFAITLPDDRKQRQKLEQLGRFAIAPVSFARDARGELYVVDFAQGAVLRVMQKAR